MAEDDRRSSSVNSILPSPPSYPIDHYIVDQSVLEGDRCDVSDSELGRCCLWVIVMHTCTTCYSSATSTGARAGQDGATGGWVWLGSDAAY